MHMHRWDVTSPKGAPVDPLLQHLCLKSLVGHTSSACLSLTRWHMQLTLPAEMRESSLWIIIRHDSEMTMPRKNVSFDLVWNWAASFNKGKGNPFSYSHICRRHRILSKPQRFGIWVWIAAFIRCTQGEPERILLLVQSLLRYSCLDDI